MKDYETSKKFEHLVAALHKSKTKDARVNWNEKINGRQFDVTIRFKFGYYEYLTVIECRDHSSSIPVDDIEAFVTKSRDAKADKAVMVSSSGFQSGAINAATNHKIELFTLTEINEIPIELLSNELLPALNIYEIKFKLKDLDEWIELPENKNLPEYLFTHVLIRNHGREMKFYELLNKLKPTILESASSEEQILKLNLPKNTVVTLPHLGEETFVEKVSLKYKIISFRKLKTHPGLDPYLLSYSYNHENVLSGESTTLAKLELNHEFDTILRAGHFYVNPNVGFSYYCHSIEEDIVYMSLIESYQHGELFQADFRATLEFRKQVIEITDLAEMERLKKVGTVVFQHNRVDFEDPQK